ncbi:MAG: hypothetical protein PHS53_01380 [Candidatus Pacebacteria bacterium]|nr:hypothetical protein [Candidatus Paceibacterota bacterium]MDD5356784.1 hypothetical protein [Candidatus Paceibacterota bacterium]
MDFLKPHKIEDLIMSLLTQGERSTSALLGEIRGIRKTTKQGFYASLRKLKEEDVILIYKKRVSLNTVWIKKMKDTFNAVSKTYTIEQDSFDVLSLQDKESLTYSFSTIKNLDTFWGHSQNILLHNTNPDDAIYVFDPHYWFYIARKETETSLLKEIVENKRQFLINVGGDTPLDKIIKSDFNNDYLQYSHKKVFEKENYYITVVGDYISEVFLDEKTAQRIDDLYKSAETINDHVIATLKSRLLAKVKSKIKISKNKARAERLKKMLGKDFYIIREKNT